MKRPLSVKAKASVSRNYILKLFFTALVLVPFMAASSQPVMTPKEALYFTLKANNYKPLDVIDPGPTRSERWFDLFLETFDNNNYTLNRNDEFKWPQYSKSILNEMEKGIEGCDFNRQYTFNTNAAVGKWNYETSSFPVGVGLDQEFLRKNGSTNDFVMAYSASANIEYIDFNLKMDPAKAEAFINSRKNSQGEINRQLTAKVIYNAVNKSTADLKRPQRIFLRIYISKIILYNGSTVLGELKPRIDFFDKANLIKENVTYPTITDIDGNVYHTIKIGTQTWLVENLKTTRYNDGTAIPYVEDYLAWGKLSSPAYCFWNNDQASLQTYGALYTWYAVNTGKLAPEGWHVATNDDWNTLEEFVGNNLTARKLREKGAFHWSEDKGTDEFGFCALGAGTRDVYGHFSRMKEDANWWTSTDQSTDNAWARQLSPELPYLINNFKEDGRYTSRDHKRNGFSVRCVMNDPSLKEANETKPNSSSATASMVIATESQKKPTGGSSENIIPVNPKSEIRVVDADGNIYNTTIIGTQVWMKENLRTTRYNDGKSIPWVERDPAWRKLTTPGYCWYGYETGNKQIYGALYNWNTVETGKLCPQNWHVPSDDEVATLINYIDKNPKVYLDGKLVNSIMLWAISIQGDPLMVRGGLRDEKGMYSGFNEVGIWWSATPNGPDSARAMIMKIGKRVMERAGDNFKTTGCSVRCIKD